MPLTSLSQLAGKLEARLKLPLPGPLAHEPVRAKPVGNITPNFTHQLPPKPGSVLMLLYPEGGTIKFPLTKRADYAGTHSGQISLPGGKAEENETFFDTALREAEEEIGIHRDEVKVIGRLSDFFVIPSNFMVTPVIAFTLVKPEFKPDPFEVAKLMTGNLSDLIKDDAIKTSEILAANRYPMLAPHFEIEGEIVWGATAMMLNELRLVLRELVGNG
jgi:8-oxo-dGTP pyrophosphatase MutT (NUDIX family)